MLNLKTGTPAQRRIRQERSSCRGIARAHQEAFRNVLSIEAVIEQRDDQYRIITNEKFKLRRPRDNQRMQELERLQNRNRAERQRLVGELEIAKDQQTALVRDYQMRGCEDLEGVPELGIR